MASAKPHGEHEPTIQLLVMIINLPDGIDSVKLLATPAPVLVWATTLN